MFGEGDVEDKLDDKLILAADYVAPVLEEVKQAVVEEVKQVVVEEDHKQPAESSPDQSQDKNSESVAAEHKDVVSN